MPRYSHVQQLNNCKQPELELLALSFQTVYVCKIPPVRGGGGGFHSLANGLIRGYLLTYLLTYLLLKSWLSTIWKNWSTRRKTSRSKRNSHWASKLGFEPGPNWWEASALITTLPLAPQLY